MFALELAPDITVNAFAPGIMLPLADREDINLEAYAQNHVPLRRTGSPEIAVENALHLIKATSPPVHSCGWMVDNISDQGWP